MPNDDMTLLGEYARNQSETAFATLVERHVDLVYSVALRIVHGGHLAEEITQAVFIILARKAATLGERVVLTGWLCRTARHVSARALRDQARRRKREQEAFMQSPANEPDSATDWMQISPSLDDAMNKLKQSDHDAIVLHYFEHKTLAEVGQAMGTTEGAAKMRVNRALDRLRRLFVKKGVTLSAAAIATGMAANSVKAAPAGLAKSAALMATAKASGAAASTLTLANAAMKACTWLKLKFALITGTTLLTAAGVVTIMLAQNQPANDAGIALESDTKAFPLDLTAFYGTPGSGFKNIAGYPGFGTLPLGHQVFEGVPLQIGGMRCLWGGGNSSKLHTDFLENVSGIPVKQKFEMLYVYEGAYFKSPDHTPVWEVVFHYSDGSSATNQLLYGDDVLDWIAKEDGGTVIGPTDPRSRLAWVGGSFSTNRVQPLRLCLTAIENPQPALTIDTIDLVSCKSWTAPCIMAITAGKSGMMP
jgi:RNA polymerase sigma factor (sigma-70 family)